jgi:peptidoglycan/LPS O-acetylase OafA/YrhL
MPAAHAYARPADDGYDGWSLPAYHGRPGPTEPADLADLPVGPEPRRSGTLRYAGGLDGVRALAVTAVLVYHLGARWLPGGFLGVDVFFVLSGFLITSLLATEWDARGRIDIGGFYLRRARRLLPALFVMLGTVVLVTSAVAPDELPRLRGDVGAALAYSTNWTQIAWHRSYFEALGRPSLLQHLWSLAVEEQFYLLWPVLLLLCLRFGGRRRALWVTGAGIITSTAAMAWWFQPYQDPGPVYYGSHTHAGGLLVGAALALVVTARAAPRAQARARIADSSGWLLDALALAGALVVGYFFVRFGYFSAQLYRGGFLVVAVGAAAVVLAAGRPGTATSRLLGVAPLRWIGVRSYAIYLWHWPVFMLSRPQLDYPSNGLPLLVLRVGLTLVLADLSYRFVERPMRTNGVFASIGALLRRVRRWRLAPLGVLAIGAGTVVLVTAQLTALPRVTSGDASTRSALPAVSTPAPSAVLTPIGGTPFGRPVRVTVFGDSQGMTLLLNRPPGLDASFTLSDGTVEGCGFLLGRINSSRGPSRDLGASCATWADQWRRNETRSRPQIALVEVGAWDVFDLKVGDGVVLTFGSPGWDAYYTQQLDQAVALLIQGGAQVALLGVPCYRPVDGGGLVALPERGDDRRTRHLNALLRAAAAKNPHRVFMIDPPAQFCTDPAVATSTSYRWDGVHYYKPGAALVFQAITPQLLAVPQPPR